MPARRFQPIAFLLALLALPALAADPVQLVKDLASPEVDVVSSARKALVAAGEAGVPALTEALASKDAKQRENVMKVLRDLGPKAKDAAHALVGVLPDADTSAARSARAALIAQGAEGKAVVPDLIEVLKGKNEFARELACEVLAPLGTAAKDAAPTLKELYEATPDEPLFRATLGLVEGKGKEAAKEIAKLLDNETDYLRNRALSAIQLLGPEAVGTVPALIKRLEAEKDRDIRVFLADAIGSIGPGAKAALEPLKKHLKDSDHVFVDSVEDAIKKIQGK